MLRIVMKKTKTWLLVACVGLSLTIQAQKVMVIDTDFSKGQLTNVQTIRYKDLVKFHGHSCDGLLEGMQALQLGLKELYPEGVFDRTNTRVVSKSSPCLTDAAVYLTGARIQYNTFYVDNSIEGLYIIQRVDNGKAVLVSRNPGVKPPEIDRQGDLAIQKKLSYAQLRELKKMEDAYSALLRKSDPAIHFTVKVLDHFEWNPVIKSDFVKTDIINKNVREQ